jgi:hypothetical protein
MSIRWIAGIFMTGDMIPIASDDKIGTLYGWKIHPNFFVEFFSENASKIIGKLSLGILYHIHFPYSLASRCYCTQSLLIFTMGGIASYHLSSPPQNSYFH